MASSLSLDTGITHSDTLRDISNDYNNNDAAPPPPSIAALFLIHFDLRKGWVCLDLYPAALDIPANYIWYRYTVTWKQSIPDGKSSQHLVIYLRNLSNQDMDMD